MSPIGSIFAGKETYEAAFFVRIPRGRRPQGK
jgi:hypothetical protein